MMSDDGINLSSIGASLRAARESQSLSVEKISSQLHLSEKQIQALEQDEFQSFGSAMLTRGFIKNYARLPRRIKFNLFHTRLRKLFLQKHPI